MMTYKLGNQLSTEEKYGSVNPLFQIIGMSKFAEQDATEFLLKGVDEEKKMLQSFIKTGESL